MLAILVERDHAHGGVDADEYNDGFGWTVKREREREFFVWSPQRGETLKNSIHFYCGYIFL